VTLKNFSLVWRHYHCRWRVQKLDLCSALRAFEQVGDLHHVTPAATRSLDFSSLIRRPAPFSHLLRLAKGWRTYSNPEPHRSRWRNKKGFPGSLHVTFCNGYILSILYCFTSRSRIFHLDGDVTIAGERLQNLGLCSALRAFEQGRIFIVPHLLWHGSYPKDRPIQSPFTTHEGMWRIYSKPGFTRGFEVNIEFIIECVSSIFWSMNNDLNIKTQLMSKYSIKIMVNFLVLMTGVQNIRKVY
jgi:hypothetical protein